MVIDVQHTIYLGQMPPQPPRQRGLTDVLIPHALVQEHFNSGKGRQRNANSARRRHRNVFSIVDTCGDRLFERIDRTLQRFVTVFPESH